MSKGALKAMSFASLVWFIITLIITILSTKFFLQIPTTSNSTELKLTVQSVETPATGIYLVNIEEFQGQLMILDDNIVDLDAFSNMHSGEKITVRIMNYSINDFKSGSGTIPLEMRTDSDSCIISFSKSQEYYRKNRQKMIPVEIAFTCIFAIIAVSSFCAYLVIYKKKNK